MKNRKKWLRRTAAFVLAAALTGNSVNFSVFAQNQDAGTEESAAITAFAGLPEEIKTQTLETGAEESAVSLPGELEATMELSAENDSGEQNQTDTDSTEPQVQSEPQPKEQTQTTDEDAQTGETAAEPETTPDAETQNHTVKESQTEPEIQSGSQTGETAAEQEQPGGRPEPAAEQEQPGGQPEPAAEQEQPGEQPEPAAEQEQPGGQPEPAAEQEQPGEQPESVTEPESETETETEEIADMKLQSAGTTAVCAPDAGSLPDNDTLYAGYAQRILYGGISLYSSSYGESTLTGLDLKIYQLLKERITEVASGTASSTSFTLTWEELGITQTTWTEEELGVPIWKDENNPMNGLAEEAEAAVMKEIGYDADRVPAIISALLADCPYELYWYDKTAGAEYPAQPAVRAGVSGGDASISLNDNGITISFSVAGDYAGDGTYTTDTSKTSAASTAAATAQQVVNDNAGKTDVEKLTAYRDYICGAVSYNSAAAGGSMSEGGNPWQLIYVFDGDSSTNVVCEGYAKAFQYLCDLDGLTCYTVTGTMTGGTGAGEHMWNIVTLDGKNYLVDVTNSDTGTVGQDGSLFLAGTSGSVEGGYSFTVNGQNVTFAYDSDTLGLYGSSILSLSETDYGEVPSVPVARVEKNGETEEFDDITEAFASVGEGETATITLLNDAEIGEPGYIYVYGTVILEGGEYTLSGSYPAYPMPGMIIVNRGAKLTINSGNYKNTVSKYRNYSIAISVYGELVFNDGTIIAESDENSVGSWGIYVNQNGSAEINGGTVSGLAPDREGIGVLAGNGNLTITSGMINGSLTGAEISYGSTDTSANISGGTFSGQYGLYVNYGGGTLTGGTFTGSVNAVFCNEERTEIRAGGLLGKGYTYYAGEDVSGTLAYGVNAADAALPAGTYTIGACKDHSYGAWSSADSKVHTRTCEYCGTEETTENHQFGEDGKCTVEGCTVQASAGVTVNGQTEYYTDISAAFSAASTAGTKAEVKLLADIDYGSQGYISILSGDITLDLNGYTLTGKNQNQVLFLEYCQMTIKDSSNGKTGTIRNMNGKGVFVRSGASLTVESGRIETNPDSTGWVSGTAINVAWGGNLTIYDGELDGYVGVYLDEGSVTIHGGSISGSWYAVREINKQDNVTLYGGTYTGGLNTKNKTFAQILGEGRAYYDTETGSFLTEGLNQTGELAVGKTVSIQAAPVQITDGPSDLKLSYGFASGTAKLQVTAEKGETVTGEISYQWYRVNEEEGGTDEALTDSEGGYAGSRTDTLVLPDRWVSGGSGNFYCVVSCGGYSVSSRTAHAEIEVCPHSQITGGVCQGCGKTFEASVSDGAGGSEVYYEVFEDAWTAAQGKTAEVTLLADVEVSATLTVTSGSNITLKSEKDSNYTISGNVFNSASGLINVATGGTLTLENGTIKNGAGGNNAIAVNGGRFVLNGGTAAATADGHSGVCVYNSGTAQILTGNVSGDIGVAAASDGSTITISDGNISGRASGVYVSGSGAKITIAGGTISASNTEGENGADGAALRIQGTGSALLSGGTYSGAYGIFINNGNSITLKELLDVSRDVKYAYYSNGELVTEGLDGKTLTGSLTVGECGHSYKTWTDKKDGENHIGTCVVCGHEETNPHDWDTDGSCKAEGCTAQAAASVTVKGEKPIYYATIEKAWQAAKGHSEGATITLLANAAVANSLDVSEEDNIILSMADGVTLTTSDSNGCILVVYGGRLTLESGALDAGTDFGTDFGKGIRIYGGTFIMNGGTVSGYIGIEQFSGGALDYDGGFAFITNGTVSGTMYGFAANGGSTELTGGTFSGPGASIINTKGKISDILGSGYAYQQDGAWVNDTTVTELKGTVTVTKIPIQNVSISPATTTITYGDTATTLTATVTQPDGSANDVTYQWYLDGGKIDGATGDTYTPDKLDAGEYTYTCTATVDGYSLPGTAATVTVNRADIENAAVTLPGTRFEYLGGTLKIGVQSVELNGTKLNYGTDYTYSGQTGQDADTYTVKVEGKGNYTGIATAIWEIYQKELTVGNWEIEKAYDGTNDISLDAADAVLYGVCYQDDVKLDASGVTAQFADAAVGGNKTVTYTGSFALTGETAKNYVLKYQPILIGTITKRPVSVTPDNLTKEYGADDPELTYQLTSGSLLAGHTLTLGRAEGESEGSYAINTFTIVDEDGNDVAGNYDVILEAVDFQITKPDLATATVTLEQDSFIYDGTEHKPTVTVVKNGKTLTEGTDYTVTYEKNVDAGTASATITAVENGNYYGTQTVEFKIEKATPNLGTVGYTGTIYPDTALTDIVLTRTDETVPGTLALKAGQTLIAGTGEYDWTFIPQDTDNYNEVTGTVTLEVVIDPDATAYTITIPATAIAGGEAVSVGINTEEPFNLNGGAVNVSVSGGIDENGKLTLTNTDGSGSRVTSEMYVGEKPITSFMDRIFAVFESPDDSPASLSFKEPTETDILAGTYEGTITFSIDYTAEGGTTE